MTPELEAAIRQIVREEIEADCRRRWAAAFTPPIDEVAERSRADNALAAGTISANRHRMIIDNLEKRLAGQPAIKAWVENRDTVAA